MAHLWMIYLLLSGKRLYKYRNSLFFMGKSTINGPCSIAMLVYQRVHEMDHGEDSDGNSSSRDHGRWLKIVVI